MLCAPAHILYFSVFHSEVSARIGDGNDSFIQESFRFSEGRLFTLRLKASGSFVTLKAESEERRRAERALRDSQKRMAGIMAAKVGRRTERQADCASRCCPALLAVLPRARDSSATS